VSSISAIFRMRTSSVIYKNYIEMREGKDNKFDWKMENLGSDNKKCLLLWLKSICRTINFTYRGNQN
jgi:hypothetical protein